jgi:hypothetical protein
MLQRFDEAEARYLQHGGALRAIHMWLAQAEWERAMAVATRHHRASCVLSSAHRPALNSSPRAASHRPGPDAVSAAEGACRWPRRVPRIRALSTDESRRRRILLGDIWKRSSAADHVSALPSSGAGTLAVYLS